MPAPRACREAVGILLLTRVPRLELEGRAPTPSREARNPLLRWVLLMAALAAAASCARSDPWLDRTVPVPGGGSVSAPPSTRIVSVPPGARIEVDGKYVGTAPVVVTWSGSAYRDGRFRDGNHTIAAYPSGSAQRPAIRGLPGGPDRAGRIPTEVILELWAAGGPPAPATPPQAIPEPGEAEATPEVFVVDALRVEPAPPPEAPVPAIEAAAPPSPEPVVEEREGLPESEAPLISTLLPEVASGSARESPSPVEAGAPHTESHSLLSRPEALALVGAAAVLLLATLGTAVGRRVVARRSSREREEEAESRHRASFGGSPFDAYRQYADYCAALGLPPNTPFFEVKQRFRELALRCHPDKSASPEDEAIFKRISHAFHAIEKMRHTVTEPRDRRF